MIGPEDLSTNGMSMQTSNENRSTYDVIVIGVGGMGSAACAELARRGARVLGLEQFSFVHHRGSSHGESRIIRKAYFEHPDYVPLLHRAYEMWHQLEQSHGKRLFLPTGLVLSGPADGETIRGARESARQHNLELQNLTPGEARTRFPGFVFPEDHDVAFEPGAGTLLVEECVQAQLDDAVRHGATLHDNEGVISWTSNGTTVRVQTAAHEYHASALVITAGAWAGECLKSIGLPLTVLRKFVGWFPSTDFQESSGSPTFFFELPHGTFYGFPSLDGSTIKMAEHSGGEPVNDAATVDRDCHGRDLVRLHDFLSIHLPSVVTTPARHAVCLYTMTPDQHFVIDRHPEWSNVAFAAGFSGHGFKFCPVVGEALADLAQSGKTPLPIQFLAQSRKAISSPLAPVLRGEG